MKVKKSLDWNQFSWPLVSRLLGIAGAITVVSIFVRHPSFPTPDKILVLLACIGMVLGQTKEVLFRLVPFATLFAVYESFRGLAHIINTHVHFTPMIIADRWLFGSLPTATLQTWLWHGSVRWYDMALYITYMLHFVMPLSLAMFIWRWHDSQYWRYVASYGILSMAGFVTYLLFPAAPPWMASDQGYIAPIIRISSHVWRALGVQDFPTLYNKISPNPVAAVPSLHAAYATMFALWIYKLFGKKWGAIAAIYPIALCFGIVYQGEHYVVDAILGIVYAAVSFAVARHWHNRKNTKTFARD